MTANPYVAVSTRYGTMRIHANWLRSQLAAAQAYTRVRNGHAFPAPPIRLADRKAMTR